MPRKSRLVAIHVLFANGDSRRWSQRPTDPRPPEIEFLQVPGDALPRLRRELDGHLEGPLVVRSVRLAWQKEESQQVSQVLYIENLPAVPRTPVPRKDRQRSTSP